MAQVHNRVNAGVMDGVVYGGMMEAAEPEDEEYEIGMEAGGPEPYAHVVNENTDYIPSLHLSCNDFDAIPFICFKKKDGDSTKVFVGARSELHSTMPAALFSNGELNRSDFGNSLWDVKRDEKRSGRLWLPDDYQDYSVISFYSYYDTPTQIYGQCWDVLSTLQYELDDTFSTGKIIVDLWTHAKGRADVLMPLRWFNNGTAEVYLPYVQSCVPEKSSLTDEVVFKLETTKGRFVLDWYGDDVDDGTGFGIKEGKKTMYITEEQLKQIRLLLEGDDRIKKVNKLMDAAFGSILNLDGPVTSEEYYVNGDPNTTWRKYILFSLRHTFGLMTNADVQYLPVVARLAFSDEVGFEKRNDNGTEISKLQKIVAYIKKDPAFFNELKANPSITFSEVCERLEPIFKEQDAADLEAANSVETRDDYEIKEVPDFETANYYGDQSCSESKLCYTQSESTWEDYTKRGQEKVYVCLKHGWENIPETPGPNNPYDEYGTSMIFVFVDVNGDLTISNCRWNHHTIGNYDNSVDHAFTKATLSQTVGVRFDDVFKPFSTEELMAKGIRVKSISAIKKMLDAGRPLDEVFDWVGQCGNGTFLVSVYDADEYDDYYERSKYNIVVNNNKLLFDKWLPACPRPINAANSGQRFYEIKNFFEHDGHYNAAYNIVDENGHLLSETWFTDVYQYHGGLNSFIVGNNKSQKNLLRVDGRFVSPTWFDDILYHESEETLPVARVAVVGENADSHLVYNIIGPTGKVLSPEWFDDMSIFREGFSRVERENGDANLVRWDGKLLSDQWFYDCQRFNGGFAKVRKDGPNNTLLFNLIDKDGNFFSNQWFKKILTQRTDFGRVFFLQREDDKMSFINQNNVFIDKWFDRIVDFQGNWAYVLLNGRSNFIDSNGELFSEFWFDSFFNNPVTAPMGFVIGHYNGRWNAIDVKTRALASQTGFDSIEEMSNILLKQRTTSQINEGVENGNKVDYNKYIKSLIVFMREQHLNIDPLPKIELNPEEQDGIFVKTGYYSPDEKKVVVFTDGRHPKDVLRTVAHEFIHHMQNLQNPNKDWGTGGDLEADSKLRSIEGEAFLLGNIIFREWTEKMKKTKALNESVGEMRAFHGSPNNFDEFDELHVGEGAGAQLWGWGTYVTTDRKTGEKYCVSRENNGESYLYEVEIPDDNGNNYLNLDGNPPEVYKAVYKILKMEFPKAKRFLRDGIKTAMEQNTFRWFFHNRPGLMDEDLSKALDKYGIIGIKYENGGGCNYLVFRANNVKIVNKTRYQGKASPQLNEAVKRKKQVKNDEGELVPETCDKCGGKVVCQIHGEPVYVCKDCGKYFGTMPFNLNETFDVKKALKNLKKRRDPANIEKWDELNEITDEIVEPDDVDLSSFNIKKHLNPKFWDDGHLDTRIRLKLLDIADDFFDSLGVDWVEPEDVIITGSIANYNWNKKYSDIDLHVLVDYEDVDERVDFVREYFTLKKNAWNEKHKNLRIFGFPVEVYVQDANEPHASSGVYSIDKDKWLTEPDLDNLRSGKVDKKHVREMVSTYMNKIDCLIDIYKKHKDDEYEMEKVAKDAAEMFDEIKKMRKDDLGKYGREMCDGNIIFKALRRSDYIGKLLKLKDLTYDKINSL